MIPRSVSASALEVARTCLARYKATSIERAAGVQHPAAMLGTTLHLALEKFTEPMTRGSKSWDWATLYECYVKAFQEIWGHDTRDDWFEDGRSILEKWYNRPDQQSDIQDVDIVSREVKKSFDVPYFLAGQRNKVPCNYIIDRLDRLDETVFRVVDYKSQRSPLNPDELKKKIQARLYALAVQIEYPFAEEIWVQFDFLRYDRVAVLFKREDNVNTWTYLKEQVQRIVDTPDSNVPETLNEGCRYCPRKFTCTALQSNLRIGGIFSLNVDQLAILHYQTKSQMEALKSMADDIETALLHYASENDMLEWDGPNYKAKISARKTRTVDRDLMAEIIGPELMAAYGRLNVGDIDALRRDPRLSPAQASLLETAIGYKLSDPSVKVVTFS